MKILIFGSSGMLGHKLVQVWQNKFDVWTTIRNNFQKYERYKIYNRDRTFENINIQDLSSVKKRLNKSNRMWQLMQSVLLNKFRQLKILLLLCLSILFSAPTKRASRRISISVNKYQYGLCFQRAERKLFGKRFGRCARSIRKKQISGRSAYGKLSNSSDFNYWKRTRNIYNRRETRINCINKAFDTFSAIT